MFHHSFIFWLITLKVYHGQSDTKKTSGRKIQIKSSKTQNLIKACTFTMSFKYKDVVVELITWHDIHIFDFPIISTRGRLRV